MDTNKEIITAKLQLDDSLKHDVLVFTINGKEYKIDFNNDDQKSLRDIFNAIIQLMFTKDVTIEYVKNEEYKNTLLIEVAQEYIIALNGELETIKQSIPNFEVNKLTTNKEVSTNLFDEKE